MNFIKSAVIGLTLVLGLATVVPAIATAQNKQDVCDGLALTGDVDCQEDTSAEGTIGGIVKTIINILSLIVGVVSVIMVIIGGFQYITSSGDSGKVGNAKNTILYAIVGLVIVALAQVIVAFVLNRVDDGATTDSTTDSGSSLRITA